MEKQRKKTQSIVKRYIIHNAYLPLLFIVIYFLSRLILLTKFPLFNDESIYIRYSQIMWDQKLWFHSLVHSGKQPLMYWLFGAFNQFIYDPIMSARFVSVIFGFLTMIGVLVVSSELFSKKVAFVATVMYIFSPMNLFFNRLALVDSGLSCIYLWLIYLIIMMYKTKNTIFHIVAVILLSIGYWIKSTALLFAALYLLAIVFLIFEKRITKKEIIQMILQTLFISTIILLPLVLRPEYKQATTMIGEYVYSFSEIISLPVKRIIDNLFNTFLLFVGYVSPAIVFSLIFYFQNKKKRRFETVLVLSGILPLLIMVVINRAVHSRYILFTTTPLIILTAYYLLKIKIRYLLITLFTMIVLSNILIISPDMFFNLFPQKRIFKGESEQYVNGWSSGYGVKEAINYVQSVNADKPVIVGVRWDSGNPEDYVLLMDKYSDDYKSIYLDERLSTLAQLRQVKDKVDVYLITRYNQTGNFNAKKVLVKAFSKPRGQERVEVYKITF